MKKYRNYFARFAGWLLMLALLNGYIYLRKVSEVSRFTVSSHQVTVALYPNSIGLFYDHVPGRTIAHNDAPVFHNPFWGKFRYKHRQMTTASGEKFTFLILRLPIYALVLVFACLGAFLPLPRGLHRMRR